MESSFLVDGFLSLPLGMNSGVLPQLLPNNQTNFSTNATFRGGYISNRPAYRRAILNITGDSPEKLLFQGASYYKPDYGAESLRVQFGGRLFQFTPNPDPAERGCDVAEFTIPGDPNPDLLPQAWLWQSEKWTIVQNGNKNPIFWDDVSARRAESQEFVLGTTNANFTVPDVNSTVVVTLAAAYTGEIGQTFFIGAATYQATTAALANNATITSLWDVAGTTHAANTNIVVNPNIAGVQQHLVTFGFSGTFAKHGLLLQLDLTTAYTGSIGALITVLGKKFSVQTASAGPGGADSRIMARNEEPITITLGDSIAAGTIYYYLGTSYPITVVGKLTAAITGVDPGGTISFVLDPAFTGTDGTIVYIDSAQYTIAAIPPAPPGTNLTVININDTPGNIVPSGTDLVSIPELPIGRMGVYGLGRNWIALTDGVSFMASDIVGGPSGTVTNNFRDAPLKSVENTFLAGGGNFRVPGSAGTIQAMVFTATLDVSLGQGPLQVFTANSVFSCLAPVDRFVWQNITNPILTQSLIANGSVSQNATQLANSDVIFRSFDGIRSLVLARRQFDTWGNVPQSREMDRVLPEDQTNLLPFASAIQFDNRFLMTTMPVNGPLGVYWQGLAVINFDPISSLQQKAPSIYDGLWTGLNILQLVTGQFNGIQRAFAFCYNSADQNIQLWELLPTAKENIFDNSGNQPITWSFETASMFNSIKGKGPFDLMELVDGEIYLKDIRGVVQVQVWYRADYSECWTEWTSFPVCGNNIEATTPKQKRTRIGLGQPSVKPCDPQTNRPNRIGDNFQMRFQITGACKFMGVLFKARHSEETEYSKPQCDPLCAEGETANCEPCVDVVDCITFDPDFYNLNRGATLTNPLLSYDGEQDGVHGKFYVPPGTVTYNNPYPPNDPDSPNPPGPNNPYPPIIINCPNGGTMGAPVPDGSSQSEIDAIIQGLINACANGAPGTFVPDPPIYAIALGDMSGDEGCQGTAFSETIAIESSHSPFTVTITSGSIPSGLTLVVSGFTITISGTPTATGASTFTIEASDPNGNKATKTYTISINGIMPSTLPDGELAVAYSETLSVSGPATGPFTWSVTAGALPDGLSLDTSTGVISGTPTTGGTFNFTIGVTDE